MDTQKPKTRKELRELQERKARLRRGSVPFFTVFFAIFVIAFIFPLRPTQSVREKRNLTPFPAFSLSSLGNGDYFEGISLWFSDTFPFREKLLDVSSAITGLHGYGSIVLNFDVAATVPVREAEPAPTPSALPVTLPAEAPDGEQAPPPQESTVPPEAEDVPETPEEPAPAFINDGNAEVAFGQNIQIDDSAYGLFRFNQSNTDVHIDAVNAFSPLAEENGIRFYDLLVPSGLIRIADEFSSQLGCSSVSEAFSYIYSRENSGVVPVDVFHALALHNEEYTYFHSDHHWTALGAYYAYEGYCEAAGLTPIPLSSFEEINMGEYRGSYYYNVPQPGKLETDELIAYKPISDLSMIVYGNDSTYNWPVLGDQTHADVTRKYYAFLGGDIPLGVITNNSVPEGSSCMLIKDSFGSPLAVFLSEHYHTLYVIDYRVYSTVTNGTALDFALRHGVQDIILSQSIELVQSDKSPVYLRNILK